MVLYLVPLAADVRHGPIRYEAISPSGIVLTRYACLLPDAVISLGFQCHMDTFVNACALVAYTNPRAMDIEACPIPHLSHVKCLLLLTSGLLFLPSYTC